MGLYFQLRVWTTRDQINQTDFALFEASEIITYFEKYYKVDYPLPKQGNDAVGCALRDILNKVTVQGALCDILNKVTVQCALRDI